MNYAKLIEGELIFAPNPIKVGDTYIGNPPSSVYEAEGYKQLLYADKPSEAPAGYYWVETWTEGENLIQQGWVLAEETEASPEAAMEYLFGGES